MAPGRRTRAGARPASSTPADLASRPHRRPASAIGTLARRLADPTDTRAACWVAAAVLLAEAVLTSLIIARVPCECQVFS